MERASATAFTNALVQYKAGVRPQLLDSGAWLIPSSTPGKPAHLIHMDGDWICNCAAGANMHWPIALIIGLEGAQEDMERFDDGSDSEADHAAAQLAERLDATTHILDTMRAEQQRPPIVSLGSRIASARRVYLEAA